MQTISVRTTQNVFIQYPLASLGDRILAFLIDWIILLLYTVTMIAIFVRINLDSFWVFILTISIPWLVYFFLFELLMNGQSPGKRTMKIQVVRIDGSEPRFGDYLLRWMFSLVEYYLMSGAIAMLTIAVGGKGQRLGDVVAGTTVVKLVPQEEVTSSNIFITPDAGHSIRFPQVEQLQSREVELIQRALDAWRDTENEGPVLLITEKVKTKLGIQTDLPPGEFLHTIVKDYNQLSAL